MDTEEGNLGGAIETLDNVSGPVKLQQGLLSRNGWYAIFDTNKEILKDGWITTRDPVTFRIFTFSLTARIINQP